MGHDAELHPALRHIAAVGEAIGDLGELQPAVWDVGVQRAALLAITQQKTRLAAQELRLLAASGAVASEDGDRDVAAWLSRRAVTSRRETRIDLRLAEAMDRRYLALGEALAGGEVNLHQSRVIVAALEALPDELPAETVKLAEKYLIVEAARFGPEELRVLGRRILDVVAPEIVEEVERKRLEAEEASADERTRLTFTDQHDGTTRISGLTPTAVAERLKTYLHAFTNPRPHGQDPERDRFEGVSGRGNDGERLPYPRRLGLAFCSFLEGLDPARLPIHGGDATRVVVTIPLQTLTDGLGTAVTDTGCTLSAGQARRLACTAGVLPAVLGGKSQVLDLGRSRRLFSPAQRKALIIRQRECAADGCSIPAPWSEAHHVEPWQRGGRTDLDNAVLLCSYHHHRAHDPTYTTSKTPAGAWRFHRRT